MITGPSTTHGASRQLPVDETSAAFARVRASISHRNLIAARVEHRNGAAALVNEVCFAPTLEGRLRAGPLRGLEAVSLIRDLAAATEALRARGLAPRQLSPESIRIHPVRGAILADAGIPQSIVPRTAVVSSGYYDYLSPEELVGDAASARSLVFSLGAILRDSLPDDPPTSIQRVVDRATATQAGARYGAPAELASAAAVAVHGVNGIPSGSLRRSEGLSAGSPTLEVAAAPRPAPQTRIRRRMRSTLRTVRSATEHAWTEARRAVRPAAEDAWAGARRADAALRARLQGTIVAAALAVQVILLRLAEVFRTRIPPRAVALGVLTALVVVGAVSALAARGADPPDTVSSGVLSLELPPGWTRMPPDQIGELELVGALGAGTHGDRRPRLQAGVARNPEAVRDLVRRAAVGRRQTVVDLGPLRAWRWNDVLLGRSGESTLFVAGTSRGPLVVVCQAASFSGDETSRCSQALRTLQLTGARPAALDSVGWRAPR